MLAALAELQSRIEAGTFTALETDEDVHFALERGLVEIAGPELGGKLRAGRSRNDQIATLIRLYLLDHSAKISALLVDLIDAIAAQAEAAGDGTHARAHPHAARAADPARPPPARLCVAARAGAGASA